MIEIIKAIALLCMVHNGASLPTLAFSKQRSCQKELAICVLQSKNNTQDKNLLKCISEFKE